MPVARWEHLLRPIEELYRSFCERLAEELEAEATLYEDHPGIEDDDRQLVSVLRDKSRQWRREIERLESARAVPA